MIPLSVPHIRGNEWKYIKECLDTEWVSSVGKYVNQFEEDICTLTSARHAVACVNGTAALHIALLVAGVQPGDEVLAPTITFMAPVNAIRYVNANPVFMDCDNFYNIDPEKVIDFIKNETVFKDGCTYNKSTGEKIAAIVTVHVFGNAVNILELVKICRERNIKIVEDAAESIGVYYNSGELKNKYVGTIGDIGCYSFNGNKIITTGGGGMIVTDNDEYAQKAKYLTTQAKDHEIYYIHNEVGYNYRLTNVQAAMGVAQLEKLEEYIRIKKKNYELYRNSIDKIPGLAIADVPPYAESNYWFYCLRIEESTYGKNRDEVMEYLQERGIQTRPIWHLNHLQKPYKDYQNYKIEKAPEVFGNTLNIPCSVNLNEDQINYIVETLENGRE